MGKATVRTERGLAVLAVAVIGIAAVLQAPWGRFPAFSGICIVLGAICGAVLLLHRPLDLLSPLKVVTLLYAISFSVVPLLLADEGIYSFSYLGLGGTAAREVAAGAALLGYLGLLMGYAAVTRGRQPPADHGYTHPEVRGSQRSMMIWVGWVLLVAGAVSYLVLVRGVGGISFILAYTGGRADIFQGVYGGWFWGILFMIAGYSLVASAIMPRRPLLCLVGALGLSALYFPLQGRDLVIAPLFCWVYLFHLYVRPLRWREVLVWALAIVVVSSVLGAFRRMSDVELRQDIGSVVGEFSSNAMEHVTAVLSKNIEQLDSIMVAARYLEQGGDHLGMGALFAWIEPIDRLLFRNSIDTIESGVVMDYLVMPEHRGWRTALSPSLVGELLISTGWIGVLIGMVAYGMGVGGLTRWAAPARRSPVLLAAYPFITYMTVKMLLDGTIQSFRSVVVMGAIAVCFMIIPKGRGVSRRA
jgi:hypothetical protein